MNKYNDIEIQTAKNMLEKGFKWLARNKDGKLFVYSVKPSKGNTVWYPIGICDCVCNYVPIFQSVRFGDKEPTSLESIVHPQILDDVEKKYLSAVIKPFRDRVKYIEKKFVKHIRYGNLEYISVKFAIESAMNFPVFTENTMYKGMEREKEYTLEELGL